MELSWRIEEGDCREALLRLEPESVQCVVTSPPYFGLRDYGHGDQIGLEESPEAYIDNLVEVFREVKRVLRVDGTVWLNLGDSYNAGNSLRQPSATEGYGKHDYVDEGVSVRANAPGLKQKDLIGIPWRVAKALQEPFFTGSIKDERDRVWLAAMIDAEGCVYIHKRKEGGSNGQGYVRQAASYSSGLEVSNTSRAVVDRIHAITGRGSISEVTKDRCQPLYRWNLRANECRDVLAEVYPHLVAKQRQARIAIGCPSSGEEAEDAHEALKRIHKGLTTTIDFPAPASLFEPGWYLRSEVIWSKPNPMPESITDRPTKAHEQVFLLTRSSRYFYDAFAIREEDSGRSSGNQFAGRQGGSERVSGRSGGEGTGEWHPGSGRNKRSVWEIATVPMKEPHFATFPPKLVEPCVLAGTPEEGVCVECGSPRQRIVHKVRRKDGEEGVEGQWDLDESGRIGAAGVGHWRYETTVETLGWRPTCACGAPEGVEPDDLELIVSPTGEGGAGDPSKQVGRAGYLRPRGPGAGRRVMTRYQQRRYAEQLKRLPKTAVAKLIEEGRTTADAWAHYCRTDRGGARALPEALLEHLLDDFIDRVEPPEWELPPTRPAVVLDPFSGAGTTGMVALRLSRSYVGVELSAEYAEMSRNRIRDDAPLFNTGAETPREAA